MPMPSHLKQKLLLQMRWHWHHKRLLSLPLIWIFEERGIKGELSSITLNKTLAPRFFMLNELNSNPVLIRFYSSVTCISLDVKVRQKLQISDFTNQTFQVIPFRITAYHRVIGGHRSPCDRQLSWRVLLERFGLWSHWSVISGVLLHPTKYTSQTNKSELIQGYCLIH